MSRQGRRDTEPELGVRRALFALGLRYRVCQPVPGLPRRTIDIAFPKQRVAVFVDGCFWHGCPDHATWPTANAAWWADKIDRNRERDADTDAHLQATGWEVLRFWEHQPFEEAATAVARLIALRRGDPIDVAPPD